MFANDRIPDRQTEAAGGRFSREIRIENLSGDFGGDPRTMIADRDPNVAAGLQLQGALFIDLNIFRGDPDAAAVRHCLPGIKHERVYYLLDLPCVDVGLAEMVFDFNGGPEFG